MEAGGKEEEETLQSAFKKLRVDAESLPGAVNVSEALVPRAVPRAGPDPSGAKPKLSCPKDNWHGCMRKTSRGASRTQRRRRSKSPILHPPKFTYCSSTTAPTLSPPSGCLKHQRLAMPESVDPCPSGDQTTPSTTAVPAQKEPSCLGAAGHISPPVFGASAGYEPSIGAGAADPCSSSQEIAAVITITTTTSSSTSRQGGSSGATQSSEENRPENGTCEGAESGAAAAATEASDFQALSKLHSSGTVAGPCLPCSCAQREGSDPVEGQAETGAPCQCQSLPPGWHGVEVYSFTGLRNVISECERGLPSGAAGHAAADCSMHGARTLSTANSTTSTANSTTSTALSTATSNAAAATSSLASGSPRSCSEQARAYVDDITIEDLSGYMEYYLYIPKKMSHMAEMMYT